MAPCTERVKSISSDENRSAVSSVRGIEKICVFSSSLFSVSADFGRQFLSLESLDAILLLSGCGSTVDVDNNLGVIPEFTTESTCALSGDRPSIDE